MSGGNLSLSDPFRFRIDHMKKLPPGECNSKSNIMYPGAIKTNCSMGGSNYLLTGYNHMDLIVIIALLKYLTSHPT